MADEANPHGMKRPERMVHHRGQQDYVPKRTYPIRPARKKYAVGEGNDPEGMERPDTTGY